MLYSAMLLTGANLFMRIVSTGFQVFLSARIGPEGIGMMQLVLSVSTMSLVAAMAGIRTTTMYLTAQEAGRGTPERIALILSGCIIYSALCSCVISFSIYKLSDYLAQRWIGIIDCASAIRMSAIFLPIHCLYGVMAGYFTGTKQIFTLVLVELFEQAISILTTVLLLQFWSDGDCVKCIQAVIMGGGMGAVSALVILCGLRLMTGKIRLDQIPVGKRIVRTAIPLAVADDLRTGISTLENMIVPRRLSLYPGSMTPLAAYGTVCGMVFPILTFPMAILYGLTELLIPELAQCWAADNHTRIKYLVKRSLKIAFLYGLGCACVLWIAADRLCLLLYDSPQAGQYLRLFSPLAVMLYCDLVIDAMIKGLGQQKISVMYNILTNILDVIFLYLLLPHFGIYGYFFSFTITHGINFLLSLQRLMKITFPYHSIASAKAR